MLKLILVSILAPDLAVSASASISYIEAFKQVRSQSVWPVPASYGGDFIGSTFGPRGRGTDRVYDFHRGVDINGEIGDAIVASFDGTVVRISTDATGGLSLTLEHELPQAVKLHSGMEETTKFYTLYLHCSAAFAEVDNVVKAGEVIAAVGDSGGRALRPHLHYEVRLGTRCNLSYALNNPSSTCNTMGYDPAIHALMLVPESTVGPSSVDVEYRDDLSDDQTKVVLVSTSDDNPNVNSYKAFIINLETYEMRASYELDLNLRVGFDATSTAALDTQNKNFPYLEPKSSDRDSWNTQFCIPQAWYGTKSSSETIFVQVADIWGASTFWFFGHGETW